MFSEITKLLEKGNWKSNNHKNEFGPGIRTSLIHNDANDNNIILRNNSDNDISISLIDFGDSTHTALVHNISVAIAYAMMLGIEVPKNDSRKNITSTKRTTTTTSPHHPFDVPFFTYARTLLRSYTLIHPLTTSESMLVLPLSLLRVCVSVSMSAQQGSAADITEHHREYLCISEAPAWALLEQFNTIIIDSKNNNNSHAMNLYVWASVLAHECNVTTSPPHYSTNHNTTNNDTMMMSMDTAAIISLREYYMSSALSIAYNKSDKGPLHFERGM